MSSAESGSEVLAAREARQELLDRHLGAQVSATIFLSLNIPGERKTPDGAVGLFAWALTRLEAGLPDSTLLERGDDRLGPFALLSAGQEAVWVKRLCVSQEESSPAARLIDLDVYDRGGNQIGRASLGLPPRSCLLCRHPAVECMRLSRHSPTELVAETERLLMAFRKST